MPCADSSRGISGSAGTPVAASTWALEKERDEVINASASAMGTGVVTEPPLALAWGRTTLPRNLCHICQNTFVKRHWTEFLLVPQSLRVRIPGALRIGG